MLVVQGGADSHEFDPLADLSLTTQGYKLAYKLIVQLAKQYAGGRILATGGGGYATLHAVPRIWAEFYAALEGIDLPNAVPQTWVDTWQPQSTEVLPPLMTDDPIVIPRQSQIEVTNRQTVTELLKIWNNAKP